jgi:ElaB/YqjD/DUF883 family membrane-anchored ribosome-binding protein
VTPPDPTVAALVQVIDTLEGQLRQQGELTREQGVTIRQQNRALEDALAQISRLTKMVEG